MSFSERIKLLRVFKELSQVDFAIDLGLHPTTYIKVEQGRNQSLTLKDSASLLDHPEYGKYYKWLITGKTDPANGQISPEIEEQKTG